MVNYNIESLKMLLRKENIDCDNIYFQDRLLKSIMWLKKYDNSKTKILDKFNEEYYNTLNDKEKNWLDQTIKVLEKNIDNTQNLQAELYAVVKSDSNTSNFKDNQKRYFQIIYNMLLGQDKGPKLGLLLCAIDSETLKSRLELAKKTVQGNLTLLKK